MNDRIIYPLVRSVTVAVVIGAAALMAMLLSGCARAEEAGPWLKYGPPPIEELAPLAMALEAGDCGDRVPAEKLPWESETTGRAPLFHIYFERCRAVALLQQMLIDNLRQGKDITGLRVLLCFRFQGEQRKKACIDQVLAAARQDLDDRWRALEEQQDRMPRLTDCSSDGFGNTTCLAW